MSLYEHLGIDPDDVAEMQCGMLNCAGPALADTEKWLKVEATASKEGETVAQTHITVPMCPPHLLVWEVFFDCVPDDLIVHLYGALIDLERHPPKKIVDSLSSRVDADGDEE